MKPIRKPFFNEPLFPFELVYKDTKSPERELPDHLHDRYEIVYVHDGQGTFFIDRHLYEMKRGNVFLIPGNTIHRAFPDSSDPVTSSAVFFAPGLLPYDGADESYGGLRCFELSRKRKKYKLEVDVELQAYTEQVLEQIRRELAEKAHGYRHAVSLHVQQWLLRVNRHVLSTHGSAPDEPGIGPQWMRDVLRHIASRPDADLGLATLAKQASVTGAHFSRVFKQLTGLNLTEYVSAKRISLAKEMLLETDDSVGLIAERCGFDSLPHFHRTFKRLTGQTPGEYKKTSPTN